MTCIAVRCPHCQSDQIVQRGNTARGTPPRPTLYAKNRAPASALADAHATPGPPDHLLFANDPEARHRHGLVREPLCLWTGSVKMVISTFETLPFVAVKQAYEVWHPTMICITMQIRAEDAP
jgi:hypothetical protein